MSEKDFEEAIQVAQVEFETHGPDIVVSQRRGGTIAMNINSSDIRLVLLYPGWKKWGMAKSVKHGTSILHSRLDDIVPFADAEALVRNSGLPRIR